MMLLVAQQNIYFLQERYKYCYFERVELFSKYLLFKREINNCKKKNNFAGLGL